MHPTEPGPSSWDRRAFLVAGGVALLGACSSSGPSTAPTTNGRGSPTSIRSTPTPSAASPPRGEGSSVPDLDAAEFDALATCALVPQSATGPFGLDQQFDRSDITEGVVGHPLVVGVRVVDPGCAPVAGVQVEVWHADSTGDYSAYEDGGTGKDEAEGSTFLRGTQAVSSAGIARFETVYPGWYPGRTPHIHVRVRRIDQAVFTGQLYFADEYTASVYRDGPYRANGLPDTNNEADGLAGPTLTTGGLLDLRPIDTDRGAGTQALVNLGIET